MPTDALVRPAQLNMSYRHHDSQSREDDSSWSPESSISGDSDYDDDDVTSALNPDVLCSSSEPGTKRQLPTLNTTSRRSTSPPKVSSPLASGNDLSLSSGVPRRPARPRGLSPLSPAAPSGCGGLPQTPATGRNLPKSQPLARALFNRSRSTGSAGNGGGVHAAPKKTTKLIVPTKSFRTTFELGLSSTELRRN